MTAWSWLQLRAQIQATESAFGQAEFAEQIDNRDTGIMEAVEMPDRVAEDLVLFIQRNRGTLSRSRREGEFSQLTPDEVRLLERIVTDAFDGFDDAPGELGTVPSSG